jgi:hypothetical protein
MTSFQNMEKNQSREDESNSKFEELLSQNILDVDLDEILS